jgi:hypothetical protein
MAKEQEILEKIRKLENLRQSAEEIGSEGEAYKAAQIIHKLLVEYNLSMEDVPEDGPLSEEDKIVYTEENKTYMHGTRIPAWEKQLWAVLAEHFFCLAVRTKDERYGYGKMRLVGTKVNTDSARYVHDVFCNRLFPLSKTRYMEYTRSFRISREHYRPEPYTRWLDNYLLGCTFGLAETLKKDSEQSAMGIRDLTLRTQNKLMDWFRENQGRIRTTSTRYSSSSEALKRGMNDGRNLNLTNGVDSKRHEFIDKNVRKRLE